MKKILLPTDFSKNAWNAIVYALNFLKNDSCEFHVLHTYTPTFYRVDYMMGGPTFSAVPDIGVDIAQAGLDKTIIDIGLKFKNPKHTFKTRSVFNTLVNEVMELTDTGNFDMIIMGTQGATGAKEIFLGSHTVHVIRKSNLPVLVVPNTCTFKNIKTILFPTDFAVPYIKEDLKYLVEVCKMHDAKIVILNVRETYQLTDHQMENRKSLSHHFKGLNYVFQEYPDTYIPGAVHEFITQHDIELLTMMNRKHSFLERLLLKPNVESIGYHAQVPFLVIRDTWQEPRSKK